MQTKPVVIPLVILSIAAFLLSITLQGIRVYFIPKANRDWFMFFGGISAAVVFVCLGVIVILIPQDWEEWVEKNIPFDRSFLPRPLGGILVVSMGLFMLFLSVRNLLQYLGYI